MGRPRKNPLPEVPSLQESGTAIAEPVRTREQLDADQYTNDFLKRNRPNLSGFEQKLAYYGEHPGWVRRWVLDHSNRVPSLLEKGWRFVLRQEVGMSDSIGRGNTDIGDHVSITTNAGEGPVRQVLMETTQALFDMQIEASMEQVRKSEEAIRGGAFQVNDRERTYQPKWAENILTKPQ